MDFKYFPILRCSPEQAGFDGAAGIGLNHKDMPDGGIFRLRRGSTDPKQDTEGNYHNQLVWFTPGDQPAQLLWCNSDGAWFNCIFEPDFIDERELLDAMHSIVPQPYEPDAE